MNEIGREVPPPEPPRKPPEVPRPTELRRDPTEIENGQESAATAADRSDAALKAELALDQPSRLEWHGHDLPDSSTLRFERGPGGLIDAVNDRPVREFVQELSEQRNDLYRQMKADRTELATKHERSEYFVKARTGAMHSVLFDRRTGELFEADNKTLPYTQPAYLHPTLQNELNRMDDFAKQNPTYYDHGRGQRGGFPHPDIPGTHAEVACAEQALRAREAAGLLTGPDVLQELVVDNRRLGGDAAGTQAKCCPNCTGILGDIEAIPGKKTELR